VLTRIVAAAALAGVTAGLLLTAVQYFAVAPLLRAAEVYEDAAIAASAAVHAHGRTNSATPAWSPREGWPRTLATALANSALATGFALILAGGMTLRRAEGLRAGVLWGIAGYLVFFVAPSIGLPPELPGSIAAPLHDRQVWWVATVAATATGLWFIAFGVRPLYRVLGIIVLCAPHLAGAPPAPDGVSAVPPALVLQFLYGAYGVNALLWLVLGGLVGITLRKESWRQRRI
jgi:cobalt transporter subunit CbtA